MPKSYLFLTCLGVVLITAFFTIILNEGFSNLTPKSEVDTAINQARTIYKQKKATGEDFSQGPCLSNAILPNWVADIAHSPRIAADDLPHNQCPAYLEGRAKHFVELDPDGNLIRAK